MRLLWIASLYAFHVSTKKLLILILILILSVPCVSNQIPIGFNNQKFWFAQLYFYKCGAYIRTCYNKAKYIGKNKLIVNKFIEKQVQT